MNLPAFNSDVTTLSALSYRYFKFKRTLATDSDGTSPAVTCEVSVSEHRRGQSIAYRRDSFGDPERVRRPPLRRARLPVDSSIRVRLSAIQIISGDVDVDLSQGTRPALIHGQLATWAGVYR